ncbi:MAG: hypothetical protein H7Y17_08940 [Chlorobia bacterium]|nr:hypothetical protein [Fimbriimonadaceae bacterium]
MTGFQKLVTRFVSKSFAQAMEAESRAWRFTCTCGWSSSIWDLGGIRYKGKGNKKTLMKCPGCGERKWFQMVKIEP